MKRAPVVTNRSSVDPKRFGPVPRDVRLTAGGRWVAGIAITLVAAAVAATIGFPLLRVSQQAARDRFARERVVTEATITRVKVEKDGDNERRRVISYRYAAPGGEYDGRVNVEDDERREAAVGGRMSIVYMPSAPARSWLPGRGPGVMPIWALPLIPVSLLLCAAGLAHALRRDLELLREGRFATARVIESKKVQGSHGHHYSVRYEFKTLSGATVTGTKERSRALEAGTTTVPIVYHRENVHRNAVYPLSLATPVRR